MRDEAGYLHRLGAPGQLPEQLVAAAHGRIRTWGRRQLELVLELDAIDHLVPETRPFRDVELVAIPVAGAQALVALTGFMERVEVHDQVQFVVRARRDPRERI